MKLRKSRILFTVAILSMVTVGSYNYAMSIHTDRIEYRKEVQQGETVWDICSEIATDKEDLNRLVWQTLRDNHIKDPNNVQTGMLLIINVERAKVR